MTLFQEHCDISLDCLIYDGKRFFRGHLPGGRKPEACRLTGDILFLVSFERSASQGSVQADDHTDAHTIFCGWIFCWFLSGLKREYHKQLELDEDIERSVEVFVPGR